MYNESCSFLINFDNIWKKKWWENKNIWEIKKKQKHWYEREKMAEERKCIKGENLGENFKILFYIFCLKSGLSAKPFGSH